MAIAPLNSLIAAGICLAIFLIVLAVERVALDRRRRAVKLRICVTGTRGKSTVTRLLTAVLRESGYRVLAKTTGSRPVLIHPDGTEYEIPRLGVPSVLEQKKVLRIGRALGADALVVEMMSIKPENLRLESNRIFKPQILIITNVRLDHLDDMGRTKSDIAASLAAAVSPGARVFVLEEENYPAFGAAARAQGAELISVSGAEEGDSSNSFEFPGNSRLVRAVALSLGIPGTAAWAGMRNANPDFGSARVWRSSRGGERGQLCLASVFAANEPESSAQILSRLRRRFPDLPDKTIGLLNLRADRGDRTRQWLQALEAGYFDSFERLIFIGDHARVLSRKCAAGRISGLQIAGLIERRPADIMSRVASLASGRALVVGLGNIGGLGGELVDYWSRTGESL